MAVNLEQLIVALIFLVPGFIATTAQKTFQPKRFESAYEWTSTSLIRSVGLNVFGLTVLFLLGWWNWIAVDLWTLTVSEVGSVMENLSLSSVLIYIGTLYLFSILWGSALGVFPVLSLREIANKLKLTSLGSQESVWRRIRALYRTKEKPNTWIKIYTAHNKVIFGRLRHASSTIEQDKPIELFINPVYVIDNDKLKPVVHKETNADGMYIRLGISDMVEFYFSPEEIPFDLDEGADNEDLAEG